MSTPCDKLNVLIVEDSSTVRTRLIELLQEIAGLVIIGAAADESEAVALYDKHKPDAAVVDIRLRKGSGIAVLDHIKGHNQKCLVIMLTNCTHSEFRRRCHTAGVDHFFAKSREFNQVEKVFRRILQHRANSSSTF